MLTRLRTRLARTDRDAGLTLAEMLVAMTITMILLVAGTTFLVTTIRTSDASTTTLQQSADARLTLASWTSMLRVAAWLDGSAETDRVEELTPTKIVFYANLDNRSSTDLTVGTVSKVALMLVGPNVSTTGFGQLVEVVFQGNSTTPTSVRRIALNASPVGGKGQPLFTAFNYLGAEVNPASYSACLSGGAAVTGMCLQSPPAGSGTLDPTVGASSLAVTDGGLRGNSHQKVDSVLADIASVKIAFTVSNTTNTVSQDYQSLAAFNTGFPS